MTFAAAKKFRMPWGMYAGQALDAIAETDDGLWYLDWLAGSTTLKRRHPDVDAALRTYLADPAIATGVRELAERRGESGA